MAKQLFNVDISTTVTIELDDAVINVVDDEWRKHAYGDIKTPQDIAEHLAYNMVINNARLSQLDGWADQPDENAKVEEPQWVLECWKE